MFDKILFDKNAFDRSVSSDGINLTMIGSSQIGFNFVLKIPITANLTGSGSLLQNIRVQQQIPTNFVGQGELNSFEIILKKATVAPLNGQSALISNFIIRVPIGANLSGSGSFLSNSQIFLRQYIVGALSGNGLLSIAAVMRSEIFYESHGNGKLSTSVNLQLPLDISFTGDSIFALRRLGALNENVISLINIDFQPGETITIDTDLLQVLFGSVEDVSSISTDSIFFELNPGSNEIVIETDSDSVLDVVTIWQNRWL